MNLPKVTRTWARGVTVAAMSVAVLIATADGFAQSYAGLLAWAKGHQVDGWKADSFPLLVDLFVGVGEMGLFLLAIDGHRLARKKMLTWVDLAIPALTAVGGWTVSLVFNIGRVKGHHFSDHVTAAVPPVAAMVGLVILLRTVHRYVAASDQPPTEAPAVTVERVGAVAEPAEGGHLVSLAIGHDSGHQEEGDRSGQGPVHDLAAAVKAAKDSGMSKRAISEEFGITRYRLDRLLGEQPRHAVLPDVSAAPDSDRWGLPKPMFNEPYAPDDQQPARGQDEVLAQPAASLNGHRPTEIG